MEVDEFLAHHGVAGMKWGHRKTSSSGSSSAKSTKPAKKKYTSQEIIAARARHNARVAKLNSALIDASYAQHPKVKAQAEKLVEQHAKTIANNQKDAEIAGKMTKGEKWATGLGLAGAALAVGAGAMRSR